MKKLPSLSLFYFLRCIALNDFSMKFSGEKKKFSSHLAIIFYQRKPEYGFLIVEVLIFFYFSPRKTKTFFFCQFFENNLLRIGKINQSNLTSLPGRKKTKRSSLRPPFLAKKKNRKEGRKEERKKEKSTF